MIGILALQGDFAAHGRILDRLQCPWREVRSRFDLLDIDAMIVPGGESSTLLKIMQDEDFLRPLFEYGSNGGAIFGTCAGAILLAESTINPTQPSLGLINMQIERNAYGTQRESFIDRITCDTLGEKPLETVFIRAPKIHQVGKNVSVLAQHNGDPVLVKQGRYLAATFHPELTDDTRIHQYFLESTLQPIQV